MNIPTASCEVSILKMAFHHVIRHSGLSRISLRIPMHRDDKPDCRQAGGNDNEKR
ncbi:MAG: hypothetical protein Q8N09_04250 [Thermodesulfovibrionia bacterium]|nr:hypothetical protein [Thermodesulfovibrionia bacterium]